MLPDPDPPAWAATAVCCVTNGAYSRVTPCGQTTHLQVGALGPDIELPGGFTLKSPRVASIWEALGFTATSNNEARQAEKIKAAENAAKKNNQERAKYLGKYGYPRLVGTGGIFYSDQLSTDKTPATNGGGFGMGKSGRMWPVPDVVESGNYLKTKKQQGKK